MFDTVLLDCHVVDGDGGPPYHADIAIANGIIARIAQHIDDPARRRIDVEGDFVTPGFIDVHRHGDAFVFHPGFGEAQIRQGITTAINGNCGMSLAPCPRDRRRIQLDYLRPLLGNLPEDIEFESFSEYLNQVARQRLPLNFACMVGSGTLRFAAGGFSLLPQSEEEVATVHAYLADAISVGAFGVSVGLALMPDSAYDVEELIRALDPMRGKGLPLVAHIRGEGALLPQSVEEVITVAERLEAPLHISHFKCVGANNWGHVLRKTIGKIEKRRSDGMDITCDVYPWLAGTMPLVHILPPHYLRDGMKALAERLRSAGQRRRCRGEIRELGVREENLPLLLGWGNITIGTVKTEKNRYCEGKRITEIAAMRALDPDETALRILAEEDCEVTIIAAIACEEDVETVLRLPYSIIASDAIYPEGGTPHPRRYGTFPKILSDYVRDRRILTLQEAVSKFTSLPADRFAIRGKGRIREGYDADLTVFNLNAVRSCATYRNPCQLACGFRYVLVNGVIVNDHDVFLPSGVGRCLRHGEAFQRPSVPASQYRGDMQVALT